MKVKSTLTHLITKLVFIACFVFINTGHASTHDHARDYKKKNLTIGLWSDSVIHLVWDIDASVSSVKYVLEKSVKGGTFTSIDSLIIGDTESLKNSTDVVNRKIAITDEPGVWRAIYNDFLTGEKDILWRPDWKYRIREEKKGISYFSNTVDLWHIRENVNGGSPVYRQLLDRAMKQWTAEQLEKNAKGAYKAMACGGPVSKPPGFNTIEYQYPDQNCGSCTIEKRINWKSDPLTQPANCGTGSCVDNCLSNGVPIHTCAEYNQCACTPWPGCGAVGSVSYFDEISIETKNLSFNAGKDNADCNGNLGNAWADDPNNGVGPYNFSWSNGKNGTNIYNLLPGDYTVTVTDATGCAASKTVYVGGPYGTKPSFNVTFPIVGICINSTLSGITANGSFPSGSTFNWNFDGGQVVSGSGNVGPYEVKWNTPGIKKIRLTVTVPGGCYKTEEKWVDVWALPTPSFNAPPVCLGSQVTFDGSPTPVGVGIASWAWNFGDGGTSNDATFAFHTYTTVGTFNTTLNVTDVRGCANQVSIPVTVNPVPAASIASTPTQCTTNTGTATVTVSGGSGLGFHCLWSPSGQTSITATGLASGIYNLTVTDAANGCITTASVFVGNVSGLSGSVKVKHATCVGYSDGSITANVNGGTTPYSYLWSPGGETTATIDSLKAGAYPIVVTDAQGCTIGATINVREPVPMGGRLPRTMPTCNGGSDATATAIPQGGSSPYTYLYSNGQTTAQATGLAAGMHHIKVTDSVGCVIEADFTIKEPPPITMTLTSTPSACAGTNIGTATISGAGGVGKFSYTWTDDNSVISDSSKAGGLAAGTYSVAVIDSGGCRKDTTVVIGYLPPLEITYVTTPSNCGKANGSATITGTSGGSGAGYLYSWSPMNTNGQDITNVVPGTYTLTITDGNGCDTTLGITVGTIGTPVVASVVSIANVKCYRGGDGAATITASGGNDGNIFYRWPTGDTTAVVTDLQAADYNVIVKDGTGCQTNIVVSITQPDSLYYTSLSGATSCGTDNGSVTIHPHGGTSGYSFNWLPVGGVDSVASGLAPGTYTCTITDANNCTKSAAIQVQPGPPSPVLSVGSIMNAICAGSNTGAASVTTTGGTGSLVYQWTAGVSVSDTASQLNAGDYTITITDSLGCTSSQVITIAEPAPVEISVTGADTICPGTNAVLSAVATGGTAPYSYLWTPGAQTDASIIVTPVVATTYTLSVADANGCTAPDTSVTIDIYSPLVVTPVTPAAVCIGNPVTASVTVSGSDSHYSYSWMPGGATTSEITENPVANTLYTVTVTSGCETQTHTIQAIIYPLPVVNFTPDITEGCYPVCVIFKNTSSVEGTYSWTFGDGSYGDTYQADHCFNTPGDYSVSLQVTDTNGCVNNLEQVNLIHVYPHPVADFNTGGDETTISNPVFNFTDESVDAIKWKWSFGDPLTSTSTIQDPSFEYPDTGYYDVQLIVENQYGCVDTANQPIYIKGEFAIYVPNTFTPNNDGKNDVFFAQGMGIKTFQMIIYDRWGNLIYETNDMKKPWDGKANGGEHIAQIDTYVWKIITKDIFDKSHQLLGHVNLIK